MLLLKTFSIALVLAVALALGTEPSRIGATHAQPCGDLDGDGFVTELDWVILLSYFGQTVPPAPGAADLNGSGSIGSPDLFVFLGQYSNMVLCQDTPIAPEIVDSASQSIGTGGGTVNTGGGDIVEADLTIPANALDGTETVTLDSVPMPLGGAPTSFALSALGDAADAPVFYPRVLDISSGDPTLDEPGTLTFSYTNAAVTQGNEATLGIIHLSGNSWEYVPVFSRDLVSNTITVKVDSFSIYGIYEPVVTDTDSDGCRDVDEQQTVLGTQLAGGRRDPLTYWDFYDTPVGTFPDLVKDRAVTGTDFFAVLARFNSTGDPSADPLAAPPAPPAYHPTYDHTGASIPPSDDPWDVGPPDGAIAGTDFFAVLTNFGHVCVAP
jgi:hypothetical protein